MDFISMPDSLLKSSENILFLKQILMVNKKYPLQQYWTQEMMSNILIYTR